MEDMDNFSQEYTGVNGEGIEIGKQLKDENQMITSRVFRSIRCGRERICV